jgi:hypothetical protein
MAQDAARRSSRLSAAGLLTRFQPAFIVLSNQLVISYWLEASV